MRTQRKLSEETKKKIATALKGRKKSQKHRESLSKALKKYWETIPVENKDLFIELNEKQ